MILTMGIICWNGRAAPHPLESRAVTDTPSALAPRLSLRRQLLVMSQTLAHLAPELHARLHRIDWQGWGQLHHLLETGGQPRREAVWYGVRALVPATLELIADLRKREPLWFGIDY